MLRVFALFVSSLALGTVVILPVGAATPEQEQVAGEVGAEFQRQVELYYQHLAARRFDQAEKVVRTLQTRARDGKGADALAAMMRSPIAAGRKKDADARRLLAQGEAALPDTPELLGLILPAYLIVDRRDFAGMIIDRLIARAPDVARDMPIEWVHQTLRDSGESPDAVDNRRINLAEIGFGDHLTATAIGILMKRGDVPRATALLRFVDAPRVVENLLIQRRFAPLWPALTVQAGSKLAKSREAVVQGAAQDYAASPENAEKLGELISAYRYAGRHAEAVALRDKLPASAAEFAVADEQTGWAVNNLALALHEGGRPDEADRLFASLNEALPANNWRVSMMINRVELLVTDGKFGAALPLITEAEKERKSPYAEQLLRRLRYCALTRLNRKSEAVALRPDLLSHSKDAPGPTIDALICTGELEEAERLALLHLESDEFEEDFVRSLQAKRLTADDPSVWGGWAALRQRPAIASAFARLGRDLPDNLRAPTRD